MFTLAEIITENDGLSFNLIIGLGTITMGVIGYGVRELIGIRKALTKVGGDINALNAGLSKLEEDQWSKANASEWALRAKILNPDMRLPDPRDPSRIIGEEAHS